MNMNIHYLAGFFDGEGCIDNQFMYPSQAKGKVYVRPRIRVAQSKTGSIVLHQLQEIYGGHLSHRKPQNANQQPSTSWEILDKAGITKMLTELAPLLIIKKEQALLALWWLENCTGRHIPEQARIAYNDELKRMKRDLQRLSEEAIADIERLMR